MADDASTRERGHVHASIARKHDAEYVEYRDRTTFLDFGHVYRMWTMPSTLNAMKKTAIENSYKLISQGELLRWIGIRLCTTLEFRQGGVPVYWKVGGDSETHSGGVLESFMRADVKAHGTDSKKFRMLVLCSADGFSSFPLVRVLLVVSHTW
jgi:hypothetical protein